jgi:hypothetical protein
LTSIVEVGDLLLHDHVVLHAGTRCKARLCHRAEWRRVPMSGASLHRASRATDEVIVGKARQKRGAQKLQMRSGITTRYGGGTSYAALGAVRLARAPVPG